MKINEQNELNKHERNIEILKDRLFNCLTYKEIGKKWNVSSERVRQILCKFYYRYKFNKRPRPSYITIDDFSVRVQHALARKGITTINELRRTPIIELKKITNMGKVGIREICELLGRQDDFENIGSE